MEPIIRIVHPKKLASTSPARGTLADLIVSVLSGAAALIALAYSSLFFSQFLENDTHLWGIVSAFLLCFGVGAFGYIPAGITSLIAWKAHKHGGTRSGLLTCLALALPWVILSAALVFVSDLSKIYSLPMLITALVLIVWALISLRIFHKG